MNRNSHVIFRQAGNNVRLGNTLVWVGAAHQWCERNGFFFHFPAAKEILSGIIDETSPILNQAESFGKLCVNLQQMKENLPELCIGESALSRPSLMSWVEREISKARAEVDYKKTGNGLISLAPEILGCILCERGPNWDSMDSMDTIEFVRSHEICLVNEPHPFKLRDPIEYSVMNKLFPPSGVARELFASNHTGRGIITGLHVRQTDYRRWQGGRHFKDGVFYNTLALGILRIMPPLSSLVISHDGEFEADADLVSNPAVIISSGTRDSVCLDFLRFSNCDVLNGPPSTFTIQAARMGRIWSSRTHDRIQLDEQSGVIDIIDALRLIFSARGVKVV